MSLAILDLDAADDPAQSVDCDVCIIGAGALGSYLGALFGRSGMQVVVLEAGPQCCASPESAGFVPDFSGAPYPAATEGRSFGLGGSTSRWGGLLVPHTSYDSEAAFGKPTHQSAWAFLVEEISRAQESVLRDLGYDSKPDFSGFAHHQLKPEDVKELQKAGLHVNSSLMLPFRRKNLSFLLAQSKQADIRVYCNAVVNRWATNASGEIQSVAAVSPDRSSLEVKAPIFVLAAGAIESARILLEIQESNTDLSISPEVGQYLGDHLSVAIADVVEADQPRVASDFAPRFSGSWMRSFRFMTPNETGSLPRSFSHFVFHNQNPGFQLAKNVLGALQAKRLPGIGMKAYAAGFSGALKLAHGRFLKSKLYVPPDTRTCLQLDIEQPPSAENFIRLSDQRDALGRRKVDISWQISELDLQQVKASAESVLSRWHATDLPRLDSSVISPDASKPHDAYHPVGTCRLGDDDLAVVDFDLRVRGLTNLYALTTGLLPTAGAANPTFSILCLANYLGEQLAKDFKAR